MKISEKIKKGLECCILECDDTSLVDHCRVCPYQPNGVCFRRLITDALAYINELEDAVCIRSNGLDQLIAKADRMLGRDKKE